MLEDLFSKAEPKQVKNTVAIIAPHAGYVYSGIVAASSFNQVDPTKAYENVFVIASSHRAYYDGSFHLFYWKLCYSTWRSTSKY